MIVPPLDDVDSEIVFIPAAVIVTPLAVEVLEVIIDVFDAPAPTPKIPSFVIDPSTSVPVRIILSDAGT